MAMKSSTVLFTVVPDPTSGGKRASVLVTPRLYSNDSPLPTLGGYDFGATPWPARLLARKDQLQVIYGGGAPVPVKLVEPAHPSEALDPALWNHIFPASREVIPFAPDFGQSRKF